MVGTNLMEELDCGNFFDHIDDLLDFPSDDFDADLLGGCGDSDAFASVFPVGSSEEALLGFDSVFSGNRAAADLSAELAVPYEDIVQLEWMSNFMDDSFSGGGMTVEKKSSVSSTKDSSQAQFQTSSPVSVLESSSSCSDGKAVPVIHEKRARSKRPRPATFNPRPAIQLISPSSSFTENPLQAVFIPCASAESGANSAESRPLQKVAEPVLGDQPKKKKKKTKNAPSSYPGVTNPNPNPNAAPLPVRKCMHCEITKTPQWRAGPMGPKTLCNACGVRYKSGRLFPEYRPAASPTFIPSVHSNSHKKVIEMRNSGFPEKPSVSENIPSSASNAVGAATATVVTQQPVLIPRSDLLPTRE